LYACERPQCPRSHGGYPRFLLFERPDGARSKEQRSTAKNSKAAARLRGCLKSPPSEDYRDGMPRSKPVSSVRVAAPRPEKVIKNATYWILFLGQTIGDLTILSHLVPLLRRLLASALDEKPPLKIFIIAAVGVTLIQVCYWLDQHRFATLRLGQNLLLGHLVLFLSRLNHIRWIGVFRVVPGSLQ